MEGTVHQERPREFTVCLFSFHRLNGSHHVPALLDSYQQQSGRLEMSFDLPQKPTVLQARQAKQTSSPRQSVINHSNPTIEHSEQVRENMCIYMYIYMHVDINEMAVCSLCV